MTPCLHLLRAFHKYKPHIHSVSFEFLSVDVGLFEGPAPLAVVIIAYWPVSKSTFYVASPGLEELMFL